MTQKELEKAIINLQNVFKNWGIEYDTVSILER